MMINIHPKENQLFNAFFFIFIVHTLQTGIGVIGLPRIVYLEAKHDAWISVFLSGVVTAVVLAMMYLMLKQYDSADLYGIHFDVFGKWLGSAANILYMLYMTLCFFVILMNYIEIVVVWIFPDLRLWLFSLVLILLSIYGVYGGVRIIVGVAFFSVLGTIWLLFVLFVPMQYADPKNLLPVLNIDFLHILEGVYRSSLSMMGFELMTFFYPFVKEKNKVLLYTQLGNLLTTVIFTTVTIMSITFFPDYGLAHTIWPLLSMFKIVRLPNLERFEFIAVSFWMLIILPNLCAYLWAASKGFNRIMAWKQKKGIWILAIMVWGGTFVVKTRFQMNAVNDFVAYLGSFAAFGYPVILSVIVLVKKWYIRRKANATVS